MALGFRKKFCWGEMAGVRHVGAPGRAGYIPS